MSLKEILFADKEGNLVFGEKPNLPIIVWAGSKLLTLVPMMSKLQNFLELLAFGAIFTWSWMEIFQGTCLFRRILGAVVMVLLFVL